MSNEMIILDSRDIDLILYAFSNLLIEKSMKEEEVGRMRSFADMVNMRGKDDIFLMTKVRDTEV
jgi:hypothetical protein